jgi:hypothetical protein
MELNIYSNEHQNANTEYNSSNGINRLLPSSSIPFLKCLSAINGSSFKLLQNQIISLLNNHHRLSKDHEEFLFKLLVLFCLNGNDYTCNSIMARLLLTPIYHIKSTPENKPLNSSGQLEYSEWPILIKLRQEVNHFHTFNLRETIKSLVNALANDSFDKNDLPIFIQNLLIIYDWDLKNRNFMRLN